MLTGSAPMLLFGKIYTFYSPKWVLLSAIGLFEVGSAICGAAPNSTAFILGRAIAGLGSSGIFTGIVVGTQYVLPLQKRPMVMGMMGGIFGISSVAGPLLGGALTDRASWRWCFYINLPIGGLAMSILAIVLKLPAPSPVATSFKKKIWQLDPLGTFCFLPGIICILLALQWGGVKYPWNSGRIIALFVIGGLLFIIFVGIQIWLQDGATVPPRIIKQRSIAAGFVFCICIGAALMVMVVYVSLWFQAVKGVSAIQSGIDTLPLLLSLAFGAMVGGATVSRLGYYVPFMIAGPVFMTIGAGLITTFRLDTPQPMWTGYQILFGFGLGTCMQQASVAAQTILSINDIAIGAALMMLAQQLSGAMFVPIGQSIFTNSMATLLAKLDGVDAATISGFGATNLRDAVPAEQMESVLRAYNDSLTSTFTLVAVVSGLAIVPALAMEWKSVKGKNGAQKAALEE